jgi:protein O-GlcNAc transferase
VSHQELSKGDLRSALELGLEHHLAGRLADAETFYRRFLRAEPDHAYALSLMGAIAMQAGRADAAMTLLTQALALDPTLAGGYSNLGVLLSSIGRLDEAVLAYKRAIDLQPNSPDAYNNLGSVYLNQQRLGEAIVAYENALSLKPDYAEAWNGLAASLEIAGHVEEATAACQKALALRPDYPEAYVNLGNCYRSEGRIDAALDCCARAVSLRPSASEMHSNFLFMLYFQTDQDPVRILSESRRWNDRHALPLRAQILPHENDRSSERRLRVGYVSPDFRRHVVGMNMVQVLEQHDRTEMEVFCYSNGFSVDDVTERCQRGTDHWRDIVGHSDEDVAKLVRCDKIDILVDLALHSAHNRLLLFARKPAPVQITYLGYPGTTGLETMDYRMSDPYLDEEGADGGGYSEKTALLSRSYWCYVPLGQVPDVSPLPALSNGYVTLGCLNKFAKISEAVLDAWIDIMMAVSDSRLLLNAPAGARRESILDRFEKAGVRASRVSFVPLQVWDDYIRTWQEIDIALDPFPFNGGITSCDALWMGVPIVTLRGHTAVGRGGCTVLSNIGMPEMIAETTEAYVDKVSSLTLDLRNLASLRSNLRDRMKQSALCDAKGHVTDMEAVYRRIWREWCNQGATVG